ncbi:HEAT repeat domain-containing protein [Geotalea sp. SG265]|uniref:HEAT repeat domain-containing protein n=1 Tax=Geotalea sp. SG265 TaxID=2922867 RepID=UPI001FAE8633|nr:HEAT repeat domain-containing protein [Geotalea sp. SG265]
MHLRKPDTSLDERRGIVRLLDRVKEDDISLGELEEIGRALKKSDSVALRQLVRRLWLEQCGDHISRYVYLLDFFDPEEWLDQLIGMALKRRDLDDVARAAIRSTLEGQGVDVTHPPLSSRLSGSGNGGSLSLPQILGGGEEGLVAFMEEFLLYPREMRLTTVGQLARMDDPRVVSLLEIMLRTGDDDITAAALSALGYIRHQESAVLLRDHLSRTPELAGGPATRSLRRLSFLGIVPESAGEREAPLPFHRCCTGPPDGDGYRTLVFARSTGRDTLTYLSLQLHEVVGIVGARGSSSAPPAKLEDELIELQGEEEVVAVEPEYALCLLRDALYRNRETATELPAEFLVRSGMFNGEELVPAPYDPPLQPATTFPSLAAGCLDEVADDDFFSCWFMTDSRVYGYAAQWRELELKSGGSERSRGLEMILKRFCEELFSPQIERIHRRLLLVADLMGRAGRNPRLAENTAVLAGSIANFRLPYHFHPFLRRFALESMDMAREALEEGFEVDGIDTGEEWDD